jgi:prepilin peptidase CpaA
MPSLFVTALLMTFPALVIVAALRDATSMTIPNWISLALIAAFIPAAFATGLTLSETAVCLGMAVGALAAGVAMFALRWIGGGDAKLFAAAALWLGAPGALPFLVWTALAGGLLSLALIGARRLDRVWAAGFARPAWVERLLRPEGDIPYGIAIAAGALMAFTRSPMVQAVSG